jgi:hypothetical protein
MATDIVEITKTTQEQFLGALSAVQDTIVENYAKFTATTAKYVPSEFQAATKDLPIAPKTAVDLGFDFVTKLVDTQRAFAEKLLTAATPVVAPAAAKPGAAPSK